MYNELAKEFEGYITVRTLDIGADKLLPYFEFPREDNPLLGLRAIRFSMEYLDLFRDQLRAILISVKKGHSFRILLPMITNLWEVETARDIIHLVAEEVGIHSSDIPPLGIMMEVPAILYQLDDFKGLIDFISVGTNDLIQYLLAVDRNSNVVGHLYSGFHPAVVRVLDDINYKTRYSGMDISVCGELAGTTAGALGLIALGYKQLSVSPSHVPYIRFLCKTVDKYILSTVRRNILGMKKRNEIERYLIETLERVHPALIEIE